MGKKLLAHDYYQAHPYDVILEPSSQKGHWSRLFGREAPLHVEIGMGLGRFICEFAEQQYEMNHVGLDLKMHRIYTARHRALRMGLRNVRFVPGDAEKSLEAFACGEVARLTILFPDPWSDARFAFKRLTHPVRVARYKALLAPGGIVHFRTDDPNLFAYSVDVFEAAGFNVVAAVPLERTLTDFERRWLKEGRLIYALDAVLSGS
jgi:tRNA (guanine-N7-)-methyltransferase